MTVIPVVIGRLETVSRGLKRRLEEFEIKEKIETIQTITWLTSIRILRRVLETCCHLQSSKMTPVKTGVKKLHCEMILQTKERN